MRRLLFLALFILSFIAGKAIAASPTLLVSPSLQVEAGEPGPSGSSLAYELGYEVILQYNGNNYSIASVPAAIAQGPPVGAVSIAYSLGYGIASENYSAGYADPGEPAQVIVPPQYVTVTEVEEHTVTKTVTETVSETVTRMERVPSLPTHTAIEDDDGISPGSIAAALVGIGAIITALFLLGGKR